MISSDGVEHFTQSLVLVVERGMASAHLVDLSMTVKRCVYSFDVQKWAYQIYMDMRKPSTSVDNNDM